MGPMAIRQLNPMLPMHVIGKGDGYAFLVIDYSQEHDLVWVIAMDKGGAIWSARNQDVRMDINWTMGRTPDETVN